MANELKINASISYSPTTDGIVGTESGPLEIMVDMTGADFSQGTQEIGTSEEAVSVTGDIGTQGWWLVKNTDDTNYVELGQAGSLAIRINSGEFALFRTTGALFASANSSPVTINYYCFED